LLIVEVYATVVLSGRSPESVFSI